MKHIAILTCMRSNQGCPRIGCLKAFHERRDFFAGYPEDTELVALMTCNGCNGPAPAEDDGMRQKLDRLEKEQVECVHVGVCRMREDGQECPTITAICGLLEQRGIQVVRGTHREGGRHGPHGHQDRKSVV